MISIVCVYNNEDILNQWLLKSLKTQTIKFELITIDNTNGRFKSASEALNYGGERAKGKYIMFIHQDVCLLTNDWLEKAETFLNEVLDLGIAGVAGVCKTKIKQKYKIGIEMVPEVGAIGMVYHGLEKKPWKYNKSFEKPVKVQTLDEQILIIPKNVFSRIKFDEKICDGWHLYGVDYSLSIKRFNIEPYVLPLPVQHRSPGSITKEYYKVLNRILKKHKKQEIIYTTCGSWYTNNLLNFLCLLILAVRSEIGKLMGRNKVGAVPFLKQIRLLLSKE